MSKLFKQFRQRFGISAPKMTVQTHVAWYWRWLGMLVFLSLALALATWMYDAGRRFAGFDRSELQNEFARLRESMGRLESEAARLRSIANASESRLKIEQTAQAQLASQVKVLEDENNRLKEDLAFFENLVRASDAARRSVSTASKSSATCFPASFATGCSSFREGGLTRVSRVFTTRSGDAAGRQGCYNHHPRFSRDGRHCFQAQLQVFSSS